MPKCACSGQIIVISKAQATFNFLVSGNAFTDRSVVQEDAENEDESCLEQSHEMSAMSSSAASAKDEEQSEEEALLVDPEDSTKSPDTFLGKLCSLQMIFVIHCPIHLSPTQSLTKNVCAHKLLVLHSYFHCQIF